jgi:threonine/homoserine/homoserine lactone efflux protein
MVDLPKLSVFVPTFMLVSLTPGMCMMLSLSLGMAIGVRRTLWMMIGELVGVGLVAVSAVIGAATIMLRYPALFVALKLAGGAYLVYLGITMWRASGESALPAANREGDALRPAGLITQGFVTAIANPKGWAFFIALLPPFLDSEQALAPQLLVLIGAILTIEFCSLLVYASGGRAVSAFLREPHNVVRLNRVAGGLMMAVGVWLALD